MERFDGRVGAIDRALEEPMTAILPAIERPRVVPIRLRFLMCMLRAFPPIRLVRFDMPAELPVAVAVQGEAQPVDHEPRGLLSDAERTPQFVDADAVLAVA
jgi:hypothetical protein